MNLNDIKDPVQRRAFKAINEYDGMKFSDIATKLNNISTYNSNYYKLPNGTVVLLETDEFYDTNDIFVVDPKNPKDRKFHVHVGYLQVSNKDYDEYIKLTTTVYT